MDWGNLILFWFIGAFVLLILNFILFRFAFVRKLIFIASSIVLIASGFSLGDMIKKNSTMIGGKLLWNTTDRIETLILMSVIMFIFVLLMSFGDSLLEFEECDEYDVSVTEFLGTYFFKVSEHAISVPSFFTYYAISTGISLVVYFVFISWFHVFNIFGIFGCIALGYLLIIKPILLKLAGR